MKKSLLLLSVLFAVSLLAGSAAAGFIGTISDNFDDGVINNSLWSVMVSHLVSETNGKLQITIPGTAGSGFSAGLQSNFTLIGDYDMQVDYTLVSWPVTDGIRLDLAGNHGTGTVQRDGAIGTYGESYYSLLNTDPQHTVENRVPTADTSGTLRLTRINGTATSYYLNGSSWETICTINNTAPQDTGIFVRAFISPLGFGGQAAQITFDNFLVQYSGVSGYTPVPLPGSLLLLGSGLLGLGGWRRLRK